MKTELIPELNKKYQPVLSHEQISTILISLEKLKSRRYDIEDILCYAKEVTA